MNKDDTKYAEHILLCINDIQEYTSDEGKKSLTDKRTYDAVLRKLQIMAESTQRLSDTCKARYSILWYQLAGFRNILVHDYLGDIDADIVWDIIEYSLPELKAAMQDYTGKYT